MARLIRMDASGHSTLAEWTAGRPGCVRGRGRRVPRRARRGLHRRRGRGRGPRHPGPRAAARRRAGDHAAPDRRRLTARMSAEAAPRRCSRPLRAVAGRARPGPVASSAPTSASCAATRASGCCWTLAYTVPFIAAGVVLAGRAAARVPGRARELRPRLDHPRAVRVPRRERAAAEGRRATRRSEPVAQGLLGDLLGHEARELQRATGLAMERSGMGVWLVGEAGRGAVAAGRAARALLLRARHRPAPAARRTASRTCCWRCAPTRRASPPWPTTRSAARPGVCGGACRSACGRRWTRPARPRAPSERP